MRSVTEITRAHTKVRHKKCTPIKSHHEMYVTRKFIGLKLTNIKMELSNEIELTV